MAPMSADVSEELQRLRDEVQRGREENAELKARVSSVEARVSVLELAKGKSSELMTEVRDRMMRLETRVEVSTSAWRTWGPPCLAFFGGIAAAWIRMH